MRVRCVVIVVENVIVSTCRSVGLRVNDHQPAQCNAPSLPRACLLTLSLESFPEAQTLPLAQRAAPAEPTSRVCSLKAWHFQSPEPDPYSTSPSSSWPELSHAVYAAHGHGIELCHWLGLLFARERGAPGDRHAVSGERRTCPGIQRTQSFCVVHSFIVVIIIIIIM